LGGQCKFPQRICVHSDCETKQFSTCILVRFMSYCVDFIRNWCRFFSLSLQQNLPPVVCGRGRGAKIMTSPHLTVRTIAQWRPCLCSRSSKYSMYNAYIHLYCQTYYTSITVSHCVHKSHVNRTYTHTVDSLPVFCTKGPFTLGADAG